jgi:hypothetical protein
MTLKEQVLNALFETPGLTDRELTDRLLGTDAGQQAINQTARSMAATGRILRRQRTDGKIGNYLNDKFVPIESLVAPSGQLETLSEDEVKRNIQFWLEAAAWQVTTVWGKGHGIDIDARRNGQRWIIEAKGCGSRDPMRVNYFLGILGELLQRMSDPDARYSIALPDMKQYRGLWQRLPLLAKSRTKISVLFVSAEGNVEEIPSS